MTLKFVFYYSQIQTNKQRYSRVYALLKTFQIRVHQPENIINKFRLVRNLWFWRGDEGRFPGISFISSYLLPTSNRPFSGSFIRKHRRWRSFTITIVKSQQSLFCILSFNSQTIIFCLRRKYNYLKYYTSFCILFVVKVQ